MPPSNQAIESALRDTIKETIDNDEEDVLTVRYIRDKVEESLKLGKGFFVTDAWKAKSKQLIKEYADKLLNAKTEAGEAKAAAIEVTPKPTKKQAVPIKKAPKRVAQPDKSRPTKRRKKEETPPSEPSEEEEEEDEDEPAEEPSDLTDEEEESAISEFDDSDISDAPKPKKNAKSKPEAKYPAKRLTKKKAKDDSDESEDDISEIVSDVEDSDASTPPKKATPKKGKKAKQTTNKRRSKEAVVDSDDVVSGEDESPKEDESEDEKPTKKSISLPQREPQKWAVSDDDEDDKADAKEDTKANDSDSSEMSIVLDEPPRPKKRGRKPKPEGSTSSKSSKPKVAKEKPATKELSPTELQIKTLQSHLVKCGIRKIWAFELKQYGEDNKAKIRHLQDMLKDIGMTGRFSEQRAKEIKELRELQADLEAVKEGEKNWGLEGGRRNRGQRKVLKESSVEDSDDEDGDGDDAGGKTRSRSTSEKPSKVVRAKQELAFLGDEEDSDSD